MAGLSTFLGVLAQGLGTTADVMGAVLPGPPQERPKHKPKPTCTPCQARAMAHQYLGRSEPDRPAPRTIGKLEPRPRVAPKGPSKGPSKAPRPVNKGTP